MGHHGCMAISEQRLIRLLADLRLPSADFVVAGSGPLLVHGIKPTIHDIDVVARGRAWMRAAQMSKPVRSRSGLGSRISLFNGEVEIFDHWIGGLSDINAMIDSAEWIDGIPFLSLADTLTWKRGLGRAKDLRDIALIERYLAVPAH